MFGLWRAGNENFDRCRRLPSGRFDRADSRPIQSACADPNGAQTLIFGKGTDSVDFALVNRVHPGDLVITQDYGLASMCLARRARVLNQNGLEYTSENIDSLLFRRHENKKLLRAGKHPKGASKRTKEQNMAYKNALEKILQTV